MGSQERRHEVTGAVCATMCVWLSLSHTDTHIYRQAGVCFSFPLLGWRRGYDLSLSKLWLSLVATHTQTHKLRGFWTQIIIKCHWCSGVALSVWRSHVMQIFQNCQSSDISKGDTFSLFFSVLRSILFLRSSVKNLRQARSMQVWADHPVLHTYARTHKHTAPAWCQQVVICNGVSLSHSVFISPSLSVMLAACHDAPHVCVIRAALAGK